MNCVKANGKDIVYKSEKIHLKGVGLGCWRLMENFMVGFSGTDWQIRNAFKLQYGQEFRDQFFQRYTEDFFNESDVKYLKQLGFNCIRLAIDYRRLETDLNPFVYSEEELKIMDAFMKWTNENQIFVIFDLHAAPGGQNTTPPSDNTTGYSELYYSKHCQDRSVALFEELARRYKHCENLVGYELLNEAMANQDGPLTFEEQLESLNKLYHRMITAIRKIDPEHMIIFEWSEHSSRDKKETLFDNDLFTYENIMLTYHHYPIWKGDIDFAKSVNYDSKKIKGYLLNQIEGPIAVAARYNVPLLMGEFAICSFSPASDQAPLVDMQMQICEEFGIHWTAWTYKDTRVMGIVNSHEQSTWSKFAHNEEIRAVMQQVTNLRHEHFDQHYVANFGKTEKNTPIYDAAFNDEVRGQNRVELEWQLRKLTDMFTQEEVAKMPESFKLNNCVLNKGYFEVLRPYLPEFRSADLPK